MFIPKYTITNTILKNIGGIEAAKEIIASSPLIPVYEIRFQKEALGRFIHHGTHLEGNRLSLEEVRDLLDGREVMGRDLDIAEAAAYRNVFKFLEVICNQVGTNHPYTLTLETILEMHRLAVDQIAHPDKVGKFRTKQVVLKNTQTGQVSYSPPPAAEIPYLVEDLIHWINSEGASVHPVIKAGIIHYELFRIHPFSMANGRVARALTNLILFLEGYDLHKLFALEEHYDQNPMDYYLILQSVSNQKVLDSQERDLTIWLEYFTTGVASEFSKVKEKVRRISTDTRVKDTLGEQVTLNERQLIIMEYLHRHKAIQNKDFRKIFPDHSDDTVLRELKFLRQKGLVKKTGGTKNAIYALAR